MFYATFRLEINNFPWSDPPEDSPEDCTALDHWLREIYHNREHRSTGQTPLAHYAAHCECVCAAPKDLQDHFRHQARRRLAKDRTISLQGRLLEAPIALIGKQITLFYHPHDPTHVEARYEGKSYGMLRVVDLMPRAYYQQPAAFHGKGSTLMRVPRAAPIPTKPVGLPSGSKNSN